jgi:sugar phosphate isomerase/epimerase
MNHKPIHRRDFLKSSALASLGALAIHPATMLAAVAKKKIPIGLQLYSVRTDCAKDLPGVLNKVGKIGYKAVEFAGYYGRDAKTLRKLLDDAGLKCCGTHIQINTLLGDELARTVEFNRTIGNEYLIVPGLPEKYRKTKKDWEKTADLFSQIAEKVKPDGMKVGYHNHNIEFHPLGGATPWETFFGHASKDVVIQYDIGNAMEADADPVVYLQKFPGRVASVHAKPFSKSNPNALIGQDDLPWNKIFDLCENVAGVKWYIIEYERENEPPLVSVEKLHKIFCDFGKC